MRARYDPARPLARRGAGLGAFGCLVLLGIVFLVGVVTGGSKS